MSRILALFKTNTTDFPSDLRDKLTQAGGAPVQVWNSETAFVGIVAEGDQSVLAALKTHAAVACATDGSIDAPGSLDVDTGAAELAGAWNTYKSSDYQSDVDGFYAQSIDVAQLLPPGGCSQGSTEEDGGSGNLVASTGPSGQSGGAAALASQTSGGAATLTAGVVHKERRALVGTIGVAVVYVSGPAGTSAELTASDNMNLTLTLLHGFDVLYDLAPKNANLVFEAHVRHVALFNDPSTVPAPADPRNPKGAEYEAAESVWRDAALVTLGQSSGWAGINSFISNTNFVNAPDYTYAAFMTNYPAAWMAYCSSSRKIVFQWKSVVNSWKLAAAHFVYAHETGHTSGAPDEYAASNCAITDKSGFSNGPNTNCENGATSVTDCIMRKNTKNLCAATPGHFGWTDTNGDGVLDPFDPTYSTN